MPTRRSNKRKAPKPSEPSKATRSPQDAFSKIGPLDVEGIEAQDFPDEGRGSVETNPGKEGKRNDPRHTGTIEGEIGLRGTPDLADADRHGGRKRN